MDYPTGLPILVDGDKYLVAGVLNPAEINAFPRDGLTDYDDAPASMEVHIVLADHDVRVDESTELGRLWVRECARRKLLAPRLRRDWFDQPEEIGQTTRVLTLSLGVDAIVTSVYVTRDDPAYVTFGNVFGSQTLRVPDLLRACQLVDLAREHTRGRDTWSPMKPPEWAEVLAEPDRHGRR